MIALAVSLAFFTIGLILKPTLSVPVLNINQEGVMIFFIMFLVFGLITFIVSVVNHLEKFNDQIKDIESLLTLKRNILINEGRAKEYLEEIKVYLAVQYPEYEKEVFKLITDAVGKNAISVVGALPSLKASDTITELVKEYSSFKNASYRNKIYMEEKKEKIRIRKRNPGYFTFYLPTYTE